MKPNIPDDYKIQFWYENGKLDAICFAKFEGKDIVLQKTYKCDEIAEILFTNFKASKQGE